MTDPKLDNCALAHSLNMGGDGLRVVVKDCIDIQGTVSACGSAALKDQAPAARNAQVVDTLLSKNCKIVGKANMHELAFGMTGVNDTFGTPVNPRWPDRIPGGSSSGSAVAVAAGLCDFAVGTDTGGSVRQPAVCCGVYGIKPTFGRIDRQGCSPSESSLDCVGVFARSATMLTEGMKAIDPTFTEDKRTKPPRLALAACDADPVIWDRITDDVTSKLPGIETVSLPNMKAAFDAAMVIIGIEAARAYGPLIDGHPPLGADVRNRLLAALEGGEDAAQAAEEMRATFTQEVDAALEACDVLITPALPNVPPTLTDAKDPARVLPLTGMLRPFNLSGHPAIVMPLPVGAEGLPGGLQLIGRKGEDSFLCAVAEWLSDTLPVFQMKEA